MSKTRTRWITGETPASAAKQNEQTVDAITPGMLICNSVGGIDSGAAETSTHAISLIFSLGWYPWNPAKSVFDRLRIFSNFAVNGGSGTQRLEYSVSSGVSWISTATGAVAAPVDVLSPFSGAAGGDLDVDLSGFNNFRWIGFRWFSGGGAAINWLSWYLSAFLYRSDAFDTFADVDPF